MSCGPPTRQKPDVPSSREEDNRTSGMEMDIPIGVQTVQVPLQVTSYLRSLPNNSAPELDATQVWFSHLKGKLVLHLGDFEHPPFCE
jgi:hypothetical protein